ncbi:hypothetical protein [Sphingomonas sp.]|uniref:hypothetical protein n=1 Tax=Sphingomonas sp. TaxID=28214 RepID=UPI002E3745B8|nr:hypothetical protein [Sphingomonas sp.]HEX4692976.1 hypothetical protein [Sphingomonas sp.]
MGILILIAAAAAIGAYNYYLGYEWSRLDHNPWAGKFLGGNFSGPTPGWNPGAKSVDEIRRYGREMMTVVPIVTVVMVAIFALIAFAGG